AMVVNHAEAETFFVAGEYEALAAGLRNAGQLSRVRRLIGLDAADELATAAQLAALADAEPADDVDAALDEYDPHVMLYTSGTTGSPKGTLLSHRSYWLQASASHLQLGINEDDVALSMFPMFHMGGWALPLGLWHTGATAVIVPKAVPRAMLETIERE